MFKWLFKQFLRIWHFCEYDFNGNIKFTPKTILEYSECLGIEFSYRERMTLLAMKDWAETMVRTIKEKETED